MIDLAAWIFVIAALVGSYGVAFRLADTGTDFIKVAFDEVGSMRKQKFRVFTIADVILIVLGIVIGLALYACAAIIAVLAINAFSNVRMLLP